MQTRFSESTSISAAQLGGLRVAAKIMDKTRSEDAVDIFELMRTADEDLVTAIEDNMFDFENLVDLADRDIQTMINNFDEEELRTLLKEQTSYCLINSRATCLRTRPEMFQDEMDIMPPRNISGRRSKKIHYTASKKTQDQGELILASPEGGDFV